MANAQSRQKQAPPQQKLSVEELRNIAADCEDVKAMNAMEKLSRVRVWFAVNGIRPSGHNEYSNYDYVQLGDFLPEATILFDTFRLLPVVTFPDPSTGQMVVYNMDKPDDVLTFFAPMGTVALKGCHPAQNMGAQQTYARRYLYALALDLVESEGLDGQPPVDPEEEIKKLKSQIKEAIDGAIGKSDDKASVRTRIVNLSTDTLGTPNYLKLSSGDESKARAFLDALANEFA